MSPRARRRLISLAALFALLTGQCATLAAEPASARAFLVWVFSHYPLPQTSTFDPVGRSSGTVFDPPMIALFRQNDRMTPRGDEGSLDGDPICDCQDDTGLVVRRMTVVASQALAATVRVDLVETGGDKRTEDFDLVLAAGRWRIHDIRSKDTPSLRAYMIKSNRELEGNHR